MNDIQQEQNTDVDDDVVWTPKMADRRLSERRSGFDRRSINGRTVTVSDRSHPNDRRGKEERRKVRLTITGRAIDVK